MVVIACSRNPCTTCTCTFWHFSPANMERLPIVGMRSTMCRERENCTRPECFFNHPSPSTYIGRSISSSISTNANVSTVSSVSEVVSEGDDHDLMVIFDEMAEFDLSDNEVEEGNEVEEYDEANYFFHGTHVEYVDDSDGPIFGIIGGVGKMYPNQRAFDEAKSVVKI